MVQRPIIPAVVSQHLEDACSLRAVRSVLVRAPHVKLLHLGRADERLAAHLDGLSVAGDDGVRLSQAALEEPNVGALFVAAVLAIQRRDMAQMERLLALVGVVPDAARALASALGWVPAPLLRGITAPLLASANPVHRFVGLAACALHRVDPGAALAAAVEHPDPRLRARALQLAGELGRVDTLPGCMACLADEDAACRFAAARSAVLLGDRGAAWQVLAELAMQPGPRQDSALALALLSAQPDAARAMVSQLVAQQAPFRTVLKAAGWSGDAQVMPWVFKHLADDRFARLAGEAFSFISGADLALLSLERVPPEQAEGGPTDDPDDDNVAMDEDESLPWPDLAKVQAWWQAHRAGMPGQACFAGAPPGRAHCVEVLEQHPQRRRFAAALHLSLAQPGTSLFNCAAPAHRQRRLLTALRGAG